MNKMLGCREDSDGFTILEFVYASVILLIVAMGVMTAVTYVATSSRDSAMKIAALNLANERLELARNLSYDEVGLTNADGTPAAIPGSIRTPETVGAYTVETDVSWARSESGRALYKQVAIVVRWGDEGQRSIALSSSIFGKSALVNTGDLSVTVLDEETNEPVVGVRVTITPSSGASFAADTQDTGEAFWGYLPTGTYTLSLSKSGYIWDESTLATADISADLLTTVVVKMQRPSTIRVLAVDEGGTAIVGATVTLSRTGAPPLTLVSDGVGAAQFGDLVVGTYDIAVSAPNRAPASAQAQVTAGGQSIEVSVTLPTRSGLTVQVFDPNTAPMNGATVSVVGPLAYLGHVTGSPTTTVNGEASFGVLGDGTYRITVSKDGYVTQSRDELIGANPAPVVFNLALAPTEVYGSIRVRTMHDNNQHFHAAKRVRLTGPGNYSLAVTTDSQGYYTFTGLSAGNYTIYHDWDGEKYDRHTHVTVQTGEETYKEVRAD